MTYTSQLGALQKSDTFGKTQVLSKLGPFHTSDFQNSDPFQLGPVRNSGPFERGYVTQNGGTQRRRKKRCNILQDAINSLCRWTARNTTKGEEKKKKKKRAGWKKKGTRGKIILTPHHSQCPRFRTNLDPASSVQSATT